MVVKKKSKRELVISHKSHKTWDRTDGDCLSYLIRTYLGISYKKIAVHFFEQLEKGAEFRGEILTALKL